MTRVITLCLALLTIGSSLFAGPITLDKRQRDKLKKETVYAIDLIQRYHYKQTTFADIDSADLLKAYIEDLDSSHMFFLQEDVDFILQRFSSSLKPSYMYVGDLFPAFEIFNVYHDRIMDRLDWIDSRLQEPFQLDSDETYLTDRSEVEWPQTMKEADTIWEKRLTHELIMELLEDEPMERAIDKIAKRYERTRKFLNEIEVYNVQETFLTSLAQLYDPHSNFFSWDSAQEFDMRISNALVGIGATLRDIDGYCVIERLIPGGPAEMSGKLHPGDKIIEVAQGDNEPVDVIGMKLKKIVHQIRGEEGTEVRLTVQPAHSAKRKIVPIVREKVKLTAQLASADLYEVPGEGDSIYKVGVIDLPSFYRDGGFGQTSTDTSQDVEELINKLKDESVDGIVLDLRNNPGGRLIEAIDVTGLFISKGPVVMKRSFNGEVEENWDRNEKVAWDGPLVVLVSRSSASASEIVAGALQNLGRAIVVGDEATHGKGTVQMPIDLSDVMQRLPFSQSLEVGKVKVTVQQYYLPNGDSVQARGVLSDIPLPSANMFLMDGEGELDNALSWGKIPGIEYQLPERQNPQFAIVKNDILSQLRKQSELRQTALEEFSFLQKNIAWYKERHDMDFTSLNLEQRRLEKDELETRRDLFEDQRDELSKELNFAVKSIDLDITEEKELAHQDKLRNTPLPNGEARENQFYQKVYYYKDPQEDKTHEIWVEYFDYEKALDQLDVFTNLISANYGREISTEQMSDILTRFKNADRWSDFDVLKPFREALGEDLDEKAMLAAMPAFFKKMVEVDPDVILERAKLDVPLRESLRVVRDWAEAESPLKPTRIAMTVASKDTDTSSDTSKTQ